MRRLLTILLAVSLLSLPVQAQQKQKPKQDCDIIPLAFTPGQLQDIYKYYNRTYWDGKLPANTTIVWTYPGNDRFGETQQEADGRFVIRLDPIKNREGNVAKTTILHEMCHIKTYGERPDHGARWLAELHRIMLEGAFDDLV